MTQKRDLNEIKYKLHEMYPEQVFDFSGYVNTHSNIRVIDPDYGEWFPVVRNLLKKKIKCKKRLSVENKKPIIDIDEVKRRIYEKHEDVVKLVESSYNGVRQKCYFVDVEYGKFTSTVDHVCNGHGHRKRGLLKQGKSQQLDINTIKTRLQLIHGGGVSIIESTYNGAYKKATFTHNIYGEWKATPHNVMKGSSHPNGTQERTTKTFIQHYGVSHPSQNKEQYDKMVKSRWDTITLKHWKTQKDVICRASYEYAIVRYLNENKIDYDWQIRIDLVDEIVYYVDMYLKDDNKYVEIKGYFFNEKNKNKWEEFHSNNKNSEIWFGDKISEVTGKSLYQIKKEFRKDLDEIKRRMGYVA